MKNLESTKQIINKEKENIGIFLFLCACAIFAYSLYFLFNRPADTETQAKIKENAQSANIIFDKKTIDKVLQLKSYDAVIDQPSSGKNPFLLY